jgi:exosortase
MSVSVSIRKVPERFEWIGLTVVGALMALLFGSTAASLWEAWNTNPDASHGVFVPLIAAGLFWSARDRWRACPRTAPGIGLAILVVGLLLQVAAAWGGIRFAQPVALVLALAGVTAYLIGWAAFRELLFPFAFLLFMVPWPDLLVERISFPMQLMTSTYAAMFAGLLGVPVRADGVNLFLPERGVSIAVAVACSGMRSLVALLAIAALVAYSLRSGMGRRWLLFAAGVPIALAANVLRVLLILLVGNARGQAAALWFHDHSSPVLFFLCSLGLLGLRQLWDETGRVGNGTTERGDRPSSFALSPRLPLAPSVFVLPCLLLALAGLLSARAAAEDSPSWLTGEVPRLGAVPAVVGPWRMVREQPLDADSLRVLEPDATLWRIYQGPAVGQIDLLVVYGHRKKTFHSPAFCIPGGGYQVISKRQAVLEVPGDRTPAANGRPSGRDLGLAAGRQPSAVASLPLNAMTVQKGDSRLLVCYWYAEGDETTPGLARHTLRLLWRRLLHRPATGALVRVITPIGADETAGLRAVSEFLAGSYPILRHELMKGARSRTL